MSAKYKCRHCGSTEELSVVVTRWALLVQSLDNIETDVDADGVPDHDEEWDGNSLMRCGGCGYSGNAIEFDVDKQS